MKIRGNKKIYAASIVGGILLVTGGILALNGFFNRVPDDTMTRGLVGYWNFDEGLGITAYDLSGNGSNGTLNGPPSWVKGKIEGALSFDGVDDYVQATVSQSTTTVSFWMQSPGGAWQHIINNNGTYYINGVRSSAAPSIYPIYFTGTTLQIGKTGAAAYFSGLVDEVRIYNRVLTAEEVRYHYNHGGPVGYWKFDEGSGTTTYDSSGNNNTGVIYSASTSCIYPAAGCPQWVQGKYGSALSFDGVEDYVSVPNSSSTNVTSTVTIEAWIYSP